MSKMKLKFEGLNGIIYVYEDRITIERNNKYAQILKIPEKTCAINELKGVSLVEGKKGLLKIDNGWITLELPTNQVMKRGVFFSDNEVMDENKVFFNPNSNAEAAKFKRDLEDFMIQIKNTSSTTYQGQNISTADEILKLKSLLDSGILTQEEFDFKKKKLLGI